MREAERTLEILRNISTNNQEYRFRRLYENLYNQDFYIRAYLKLAPHEGNMTKGSDGKTIDGFSLSNVESIIHRMKLERFKPSPARKEFIPKKNGKLRPLGIGNFETSLSKKLSGKSLRPYMSPYSEILRTVSDLGGVVRQLFGGFNARVQALHGS